MIAALLAALAAALALPHRPRRPERRLAPSPRLTGPGDGGLRRWRAVVSVAAGVGGWALLGGVAGVVAGGAVAGAAWRVLGAAEGPAEARRRARLARDLPTGVDLLLACLQGGAAVEPALLTVADALGGPLADELRGVHHRLVLGVAPETAWQQADVAALRPLARAVLRSQQSGAGVAEAVARLSVDLREQVRADVLARAGAVEVRAAAPLASCFLPAFVLLAVVPLVAGSLGSLQSLLR